MKKNKKLTGRELDVMRVLWSTDEPLIATDIHEEIEDDKLSVFTVQNSLKSLMEKGYIEIASFTIVNKSNTRKYSATISADEYAVFQYKSHFPKQGKDITLSDLMLSLLKVEKNQVNEIELREIKKMIEKEWKELKDK